MRSNRKTRCFASEAVPKFSQFTVSDSVKILRQAPAILLFQAACRSKEIGMRAYRPTCFTNAEPEVVQQRQQAKKANLARYISRHKAGLPIFDDQLKPDRRIKSAFCKH